MIHLFQHIPYGPANAREYLFQNTSTEAEILRCKTTGLPVSNTPLDPQAEECNGNLVHAQTTTAMISSCQ